MRTNDGRHIASKLFIIARSNKRHPSSECTVETSRRNDTVIALSAYAAINMRTNGHTIVVLSITILHQGKWNIKVVQFFEIVPEY